MKNGFFIGIILLFSVWSLSGCSDDEKEKQQLTAANLAGTWKVTAEEGWEIYQGIKESWKDVYTAGEWHYVLKADGTGSSYEKYDDQMYQEDFTWSIKDNILYMLSDKYGEVTTDSVTITDLTSTSLILEKESDDFYNRITLRRIK